MRGTTQREACGGACTALSFWSLACLKTSNGCSPKSRRKTNRRCKCWARVRTYAEKSECSTVCFVGPTADSSKRRVSGTWRSCSNSSTLANASLCPHWERKRKNKLSQATVCTAVLRRSFTSKNILSAAPGRQSKLLVARLALHSFFSEGASQKHERTQCGSLETLKEVRTLPQGPTTRRTEIQVAEAHEDARHLHRC